MAANFQGALDAFQSAAQWAGEKLSGLTGHIGNVSDMFSNYAGSFNPMDMFGDAVEGLTTVDLVEPLMESTTTYIYQMVIENFVTLINWLLKSFDPSSNYIYELFGLSGGYNSSSFDVFFFIASFSLIGIFVFSLLTIAFGGLTEQKNELHELIIRFFIAIVLILNIRPFLQLLNETTDIMISLCASTMSSGINGSQFGGDFFSGALSQVFFGILMIILVLAMLIEFVKLIMEIIERYLVVFLLHIASPIAGSFYVSRTTSSILSNYMRMYLSQLFLLIMNKFFMYLFVMAILNNAFSTFIGCLALITFLKCAQRIDSYMKSLGLTVAQTGNALFGSILGTVATLGMAIRGGRGMVGSAGRALEVAGASKGDFGMANLGTMLKSASNHQPYSKGAALRSYTENGGLANTITGDAKINKTFMDLINSGNYRSAMGAPSRIQTSAIKGALVQNGDDAFYQATGFHAADIKTAQIMLDGSIKGIVSQQGSNGSVNRYGFALSPNSISGGNVAPITCFGSGQMYASITPSKSNNYKGMKFSNLDFESYGDNISPVAAATGATIDNNQWSNLGVTSAEVDDNNILIASNAEGHEVAAINLETGNSYDCGTDTSVHNDTPLTYYTSDNVMNDPDIKSMLPKGASVVENSFNVVSDTPSSYQVNFDWKSNVASGQMVIERPTPNDIKRDSKSTLINRGPEIGSFKVTNNKKTQSQTRVGR